MARLKGSWQDAAVAPITCDPRLLGEAEDVETLLQVGFDHWGV